MPDLRPGKVYVIDNGQGLVKVGRAENPERRRRALEDATKQRLTLVYCTLERADVTTIERMAHAHLTRLRSHGEWYRAAPERAIEAINNAFFQLSEGAICKKRCRPSGPSFRRLSAKRSRERNQAAAAKRAEEAQLLKDGQGI